MLNSADKINMKAKFLLFILCFFSVSFFLFLLNCAQQGGESSGATTGTAGGTTGGGFTPTSGRVGSSGGFSPGSYQYSRSGHSSRDSDEPFYKSPSVEENEERWGTSAPIGKVGDDEVDQDVLVDFRLGEDINTMRDIADLRVYVKLKKVRGQNYYSGDVTVAYWDWSENIPGQVRLQSGRGDSAKYNVWLRKPKGGAEPVGGQFHGFSQEKDSAVILVIDGLTDVVRDSEDESENVLHSGSVWIMTFKTVFPVSKGGNSCNYEGRKWDYIRDYNKTHPDDPVFQRAKNRCWFISRGPFDCRTWRDGNSVNPWKALEPDGTCYTKLGDFSGLNVLKAFGVKKLSDL